MSTLNEIKEQVTVVASLGEFTNALQQIATIRMVRLRDKVLQSRPFVQAASEMLTELSGLRNGMRADELVLLEKKHGGSETTHKGAGSAVIIITSNAGLTGRYNPEIFAKAEGLLKEKKDSDIFVIGKKGQEYFGNERRFHIKLFPYEVPDTFGIEQLRRLIGLFDYYQEVTLLYSRYLNSAKRDVVVTSVVLPAEDSLELTEAKGKGKYTFEPDIFDLIDGISAKLRAALFQQQLFDARLAQNSSQMIGMKTASDNAVGLLADLRQEYNKQRRKMIDKKIGEVFAGSALW
jgi:F-type H+-transporting ATPase subunit gamma